jgi:hypothetical protein
VSDTDIANIALGRLQVGQAIASLSEQSTPGRLCNRFYNQCRREVLQAFPWSHASYAVALAAEADQTYPGWTYVYTYPQNVLRMHGVSDSSGLRNMMTYVRAGSWAEYEQLLRYQMPFNLALRTDGAARVILSDMPSAYAFGTYDVTNTNVFPPDFISVLAWRLAMEVGGPLKCRADLVSNARNEYLFWKSHASARDLNESRDDTVPESPSISCRM